MAHSRYPYSVTVSAGERFGLQSNSSPDLIYCVNCDAQHKASDFECPECYLRYIPIPITIRGPRPKDYYDDKRIEPVEYEKFPQFTKLPIEIRTMIWQLASSEPRIFHNTFLDFHGPPIRLPMLYTCRESYHAVLAQYEGTSSVRLESFELFRTLSKCNNVTLYMKFMDFMDLMYPTDDLSITNSYPMIQFLRETKHLALCMSSSEGNIDRSLPLWETDIHKYLITGNFETVNIVHRRHPRSSYSDLTLIEIQDIDLSLEFYQQPYNSAAENHFTSMQRTYKQQLENCFSMHVERLEAFRKADTRQFPNKLRHRPLVLQQKIITTMAMKRKLERARTQFEKRKSEYLRHSVEESTLEYKAVGLRTAHWSFGNMVGSFIISCCPSMKPSSSTSTEKD
ncbi:hypothetical protein BOTCAL_0266g00070 [Botryotinia calthae]|uniref:2EXR domain-containing protein n=1 Tax=Botryotinia calthae TaxID=38488 RepID=A0A4Y8CVV9_9HELO|nr:hypothetical protein BOTCAL_0266g00070 [Botryotinia calthae]